tara:strand:- start:22 stop:303 length:282 start_codon:yes stop_codon:yes gene_type:complete
MKDTITEHQFTDAMISSFSYEGTKALFEYLTQLEEDCDQELEFDPIAFRCDFSEYENFEKLKQEYDVESMEELEQKTTVIDIPETDGFIIQNY